MKNCSLGPGVSWNEEVLYKGKKSKNANKKRKNENFKKQKIHFFLMSQFSLDPKNRFLAQKMCSVARVQTDTHTQTQKWLQRTPFQGFRNFSFNLSSRIGPTSTMPSCSGLIPAQKSRDNSVLEVVFFHTVRKMDFYYYSHHFNWQKTLLIDTGWLKINRALLFTYKIKIHFFA